MVRPKPHDYILPICQSELGPGKLHGWWEVDIPCHLRAEFKGSHKQMVWRTRSLITPYPSDLSRPQIELMTDQLGDIVQKDAAPLHANQLLVCDTGKWLNQKAKFDSLPIHSHLRNHHVSAMAVHEKDRDLRYSNCYWEIRNLGLPRLEGTSI